MCYSEMRRRGRGGGAADGVAALERRKFKSISAQHLSGGDPSRMGVEVLLLVDH